MKNVFFILIYFVCINCSSQVKLNKGSEIDILIDIPQEINTQKPLEFTVYNKGNRTVIIDPYGFYGEIRLLNNNTPINPDYLVSNHYYRDYDICVKDLIVLKPQEKIRTYINLAYNNNKVYKKINAENLLMIINSLHSKKNSSMLSCENYIQELEKKGYYILEDSIDAKIPYKK